MTHVITARRTAGIVAVFAISLLVACADDDGNLASNEEVAAVGETNDASAPAEAIVPALADQQTAPIPNVVTDPSRKLVITMTIGIEVAEAAAAVDEVIALAARHGGQLYDSQIDLNDPETANGDLVFKLPPDEVQSFLSGLDPEIGRRTGLDGTTSDVTTQIADLDAQILAAEASVDRVRVLLEGAKNLDDVIRLEIEFTNRQTHLEQLRAQQNTLDELVALATITVHLTTAPPSLIAEGIENIPRALDEKGIVAAFEKGWEAFLAVLVAIGLVFGYTAPFLVLGGLAWLIVWRVNKRAARNRTAISASERPDQPAPLG